MDYYRRAIGRTHLLSLLAPKLALLIYGSNGKTCRSTSTPPYTLAHLSFSASGVSQAFSGSLSHSLTRCLCFSSEFVKPSRAWKMLRLFANCTSPFLKLSDTAYFSARKCSASSASAWASVMGGMSEERGRPWKPVNVRRAYWMMRRSGDESVAG